MKPSSTELVILQHLWTAGQRSAREIHEGVVDRLDWSFSSTRKTIDRMVEKKYLSVTTVHGVRVFEPKENKLAVIASMARTFARDVLGFDSPLPISAFSKSRYLTEDDLDELEKLLKKEEPDA